MRFFQSLRNKIIVILLIAQLPLLVMSVLNIHLIIDRANDRTIKDMTNITQNQLSLLDRSLGDAATTVTHFLNYTPLIPAPEDASESFYYYKNLQALLDMLESGYVQESFPRFFICYQSHDYFLKSSRNDFDIFEREEFRKLLRSDSLPPSYAWSAVRLEHSDYYLYYITYKDFIIGSLINCEEILNSFDSRSLTGSSCMLYDETNGVSIASAAFPASISASCQEGKFPEDGLFRAEGGQYAIRSFPSRYGFQVICAIALPSAAGTLLGNLFPYLSLLYLLLFLPVVYLILKKTFLVPVQYIQYGFSRVSEGDLDYRANETMFSSEFNSLNKSFNFMVRQFKELRMDYYEEKILQSEMENRYLRTISYPHFLLNCLTLINNFAYQKNEEGIHTAIFNLSKYLRYFISVDARLHTFANDIESAQCYLNLSQLAYPDRITWQIDYEKELLPLPFPPLIISTIVENCVKHGLSPGRNLDIRLTLKTEQADGEEWIVFTARNNGPCFPEEIITMLERADLPLQGTRHMGLISVKQTLSFMYHENASFRIANQPDGVTVTIRIRSRNLHDNLFSAAQESADLFSGYEGLT